MNWTSEAIATLRRLWADGMPSAQIGKVLHCSKNAIVGKAHRLKLAPRPSPINACPRVVKAVRLPRAPVVNFAPEPELVRRTATEPCCWPMGEPGKPGFHYCDEVSAPGRVYCPAHLEVSRHASQTQRGGNWVRNGQVYSTMQVLNTFRDMLERKEIRAKDVAEEIGVFASNLSALTLHTHTNAISRKKMILLANYMGFSERVE